MDGFKITCRLHSSSCDDDCSALLQHLSKVDRWIQQQELDAALRQSTCTQNKLSIYKGLISLLCFILHCVFKMVPCLCTTTLPSVLLFVRAMKNPSTCIMGDADSSLSASTDPCWSAEDTAHMGATRQSR